MTIEERKNALHCLKVMIEEEVCEECDLYGTTGTDHCEADCVRVAIKALEQEPCEDAISRQAVLDTLWFEPTFFDPLNVLTEARDRVMELPTVAIPSKVGRWKMISPAAIYECSECGQHVMTQDICAYHYCHGCGAKMD